MKTILSSDTQLILFALAVVMAFIIFNALVNLFVRLISEARKWLQFMITSSIVLFLLFMFFAPEETGEVLRLLVELVGYVLKGILQILERLIGGDAMANTQGSG